MKNIIETAPGCLTPAVIFEWWMPYAAVSHKDEYFLTYYNMDQPCSQIINLPANSKYQMKIINGWDLTIAPVSGEFRRLFNTTSPETVHGIAHYQTE